MWHVDLHNANLLPTQSRIGSELEASVFIPVRNYTAKAGYPKTEDQARHLYRHRKSNGLTAAFVKVQGRVLMDPDQINALLAKQAQADSEAV